MSDQPEWIWVKNDAVNDIPGRVPADSLPAWEARGWVECPAPTDDVEVDVAADESTPVDEPAPEVTPSESGPKKENDRG